MHEFQEKLLLNQLIDLLRKKDFDPIERAKMIADLINIRRSRCLRCKDKVNKNNGHPPKGKERGWWCQSCAKIPEKLAKDLNIDIKTLYRMRKLEELPEEIKKHIEKGSISAEKVSRILYSLKKKDKLMHVIDKTIKDDLNIKEVEDYVAEVNNPKIIKTHAKNNLWKAAQCLKKINLTQKELKDSQIIELIDECQTNLDRLKVKK